MNRFTISPDFFDAVIADQSNDFLLNILFVFAQDNRFKLCFDDHEFAYNIYIKKIADNQNLHVWLSLLNSTPRNIEKVRICNACFDDNCDLFLAIADNIPPEKKLLTGNKSLFIDKQEYIKEHSIMIIDGDETKDIIRRLQGPNQITYGANSPIINGNNNTLE